MEPNVSCGVMCVRMSVCHRILIVNEKQEKWYESQRNWFPLVNKSRSKEYLKADVYVFVCVPSVRGVRCAQCATTTTHPAVSTCSLSSFKCVQHHPFLTSLSLQDQFGLLDCLHLTAGCSCSSELIVDACTIAEHTHTHAHTRARIHTRTRIHTRARIHTHTAFAAVFAHIATSGVH